MAFDFPNSPTNGQNYEPVGGPKYQWNGYAWTKVAGGGGGGSGGATLAVSDTPPAGAADNSLWVESDTMGMYLRYKDADGSQWTQLNGMADLASYVKKTGDTMSGDLTIAKSSPIFIMNRIDEAASYIGSQRGGNFRWSMNFASGVESSGNVGSDLVINRFSDAGGYIDTPLTINRATGVVTAIGLPRAPTGTSPGVGQVTSGHLADNTALVIPAGGTWYWFFLGTTPASGAINNSITTGVAAGGTLVANAAPGYRWMYSLWRIA